MVLGPQIASLCFGPLKRFAHVLGPLIASLMQFKGPKQAYLILSYLKMGLVYKKLPMGGTVYLSLYEVFSTRLHQQLGPFEGGIAGALACFGLKSRFAHAISEPKTARAPALPPSNGPRYGYSFLENTSYQDI